ncbi:DNA-formamidopyrimidine glycosylase [bacterium CG_4_9_14_3_um_filter_65_15]|nr:MAG: DNA-formamidopyrimidine glycosylase [bacterium CG_4_9_14_3_um_filter_65_15]
MPELPEVENVGRALLANLQGRRLTGLKVSFAGVLDPSAAAVRRRLVGARLEGLHRRGKYLILHFAHDDGRPAYLMLHLRMTGQIFILDGYVPDKHVHLVMDFEGLPVHYRDIRKFGRLSLVEDGYEPAAMAHIGPDMLTVPARQWLERIVRRRGPIKACLLDQGIASGLGNIYVDESLFLARVHPLARPCDIEEAELREVLRRAKQVLRLALRHGGTTFMNFTNFQGKPGNFRRKLRVYGRAGQPCRDCGASLEKITVAGRGTVYCPRCQPDPS